MSEKETCNHEGYIKIENFEDKLKHTCLKCGHVDYLKTSLEIHMIEKVGSKVEMPK